MPKITRLVSTYFTLFLLSSTIFIDACPSAPLIRVKNNNRAIRSGGFNVPKSGYSASAMGMSPLLLLVGVKMVILKSILLKNLIKPTTTVIPAVTTNVLAETTTIAVVVVEVP